MERLRRIDGHVAWTPDLIAYRGEFFRAERGLAYEGSAELRIDDMRLAAFVPGTGPAAVRESSIHRPGRHRRVGPAHPQRMDPDLAEFGLVPGMTAGDAYDRIVQQGICHEFRLEFPALNFGSEGQLLVFVEDRNRTTSDPNMPDFVGCN